MTARQARATVLTCPDCGFTTPRTTDRLAAHSLRRHSCDRQHTLAARAERVHARRTDPGTPAPCTHPTEHPHGSHLRYKRDLCRCRACRDAYAAWALHRNRLRAYGRLEALADAAPVVAHIQRLRSTGMGYRRIAALAGVDFQLVGRVLFGRQGHPQKRLAADSARRLLAVQPDPLPGAYVPALGVHRRIQALNAIGWSDRKLGERIGVTAANFSTMMRASKVTQRRHLEVCALYDALWQTAPPQATDRDRGAVTRTLRRAQARKYAPPLAWDDDAIDDPTARPHGHGPAGLSRARRRADLIDDVTELTTQGATVEAACTRLGLTRHALQQNLYRAGRHDLWRRLTGSDPLPHEAAP